MDFVIGTSGHIDHGKTALVKALTGVDADRFPEEKERGITIDIGFAELEIGDLHLGFVDVPGHERFVKNMLAGASGIDAVMLIVASDEGVMPQTREHFDICRLLGVKSGIVVLTKSDLVDDELREIVEMDVAELVAGSFLENAPVLSVSSRTGDGIDDLKALLSGLPEKIPARSQEFSSRLPIDRSFSVKGFGAVVTGTLISGEFAAGDEAEILPSGRTLRIRGIQTHGRGVEKAFAGQRTAINLGGIDHGDISRGMVLSAPGMLRPTQMIDAKVEVLADAAQGLRTRQRVRLHHGTVEALARIEVLGESVEIPPGGCGFAQLRLEQQIVAVPGERFIIRSYSPQMTIAGGVVFDNSPPKHRRKDAAAVGGRLSKLDVGEHSSVIRYVLEAAGANGLLFSEIRSRTGLRKEVAQAILNDAHERKAVVGNGDRFIARSPFDLLRSKVTELLEEFHRAEPLAAGMPQATLREKIFAHLPAEVYRLVADSLEIDGRIASSRDVVRLSSHNLELTPDESAMKAKILSIYKNAALEVPKLDEALDGLGRDRAHSRKIFQLLLNSGDIVKISEEFYFTKSVIDALVSNIREYAGASSDRVIDVPRFKEIAGVSRKYAIPLLEYFDREKITRRAGDKRIVA